jgi:hypothetical protein
VKCAAWKFAFVLARRYDPVRQMLHSIPDDLCVTEQPLRYLGVVLTTRVTIILLAHGKARRELSPRPEHWILDVAHAVLAKSVWAAF